MRENSSLHCFFGAPKIYWLLSLIMGLLWYGNVVLYGVGTITIGNLGAIIRWPVFMSGKDPPVPAGEFSRVNGKVREENPAC